MDKEYIDSLDFYPTTDTHATDRFLDIEKFYGGCWEPCCGAGHISEELLKYGYDTFSTDIYNHGYERINKIIDFLEFEDFESIPLSVKNIITNPPYTKNRDLYCTLKAIEFCEQRNGKVAMLMQTRFRHGIKRNIELFSKYQYSRVYDYSARVSVYKDGDSEGKGSSTVDYAWFVWDFTSGLLFPNKSVIRI